MNCAVTLALIGCLSVQLCTVTAGLERRSYQKDINDAPLLSHTTPPRAQAHDHWVLIVCITGVCLIGVVAVILTFWNMHKRLHAVRKGPEFIEMETMLHV